MDTCTAFAGWRQIAQGDRASVAAQVKDTLDRGEQAPVLVFDDETGEVIDLDLRGTVEDARARVAPVETVPRRPGRPRLGVVAREVTLLPRHWEWLGTQPGGASVALRKLVEQARTERRDLDRVRAAREAAYRFLVAVAGDQPGFEEATRALFAGRRTGFEQHTEAWPEDVREHARRLAARSFVD